MAPTEKKEESLVSMLVELALIRERYGVMRKEVDELSLYMAEAKSEKTWYKGYAAATIGICTLIVTSVTWAANNHVIQKVDELINKNKSVIIGPVKP